MPPEETDLILAQKDVVDRKVDEQIENAENSKEYDSIGEEDREMVRFLLAYSSNERFQDPLPIRVNSMRFSIPRGEVVEYPRFVVALIENHYVPTYANKINPYTQSRKKRKVKERIFETVNLKTSKVTGKVAKIDIDRQEALSEKNIAWSRKQLLKQA